MRRKNSKPNAFSLTDVGNAEFFARVYADNARYDHRRRRWLFFRPGHWWSADSDGLVWRIAKSIAKMLRQHADAMSDHNKGKAAVQSWARHSESRAGMDAMLRLAQAEVPITDDGNGWDSDPMLLGVANGVVDLRTGILRDGTPSDKITIHTDIAYDPHAQCPRWKQFLGEVFSGDETLIEYVHRAVGYVITGDVREQCLFLLYGKGANGKSTFLSVLHHVLGAYAYNLPFSAFELKARPSIPNDVAAIAGRRLVTANETSESAQLNEARIKALTGGDEIAARFLYGEYFSFPPAAKLWLAVNHRPAVADTSDGFWRRIRPIPFLQQFDGATADKELLAKLIAEAPGILAWAVQGCQMWRESGLGVPAVVREASEAYRLESNPIQEFIEECCSVDARSQVTVATLWREYLIWEMQNATGGRLTRVAFSHRLEAMGFKKVRLGHCRTWTWLGIGLRSGGGPQLPGVDPIPSPRTDADVESHIVI